MRDHIAPIPLAIPPAAYEGRPLARRVLDRLAPRWTKQTYPGIRALWARLTPGFALDTVRHWRCGVRPNPAALEHWAQLLRARAAGDAALAAECEAEAARLRAQPLVLRGFCARRRA